MSGEKEIYDRVKPHLNIGTIGHSGHGKTRLSAALCEKLEFPIERIFADTNSQGNTATASQCEYETENRHFVHFDCPGLSRYTKNTILAMSQLDVAILVIDNEPGIEDQTREHLMLARHFNLQVVVFINLTVRENPANSFFLRQAIRRLLADYEYNSCRVLSGPIPLENESASKVFDSALNDLLQILDELPVPPRHFEPPFLMPIAKVMTITNVGYVATGRVVSGIARLIDQVEICGLSESQVTTITGVEMCRKTLDEARSGDQVSLLLRGITKKAIKKGQTVCTPGTFQTATQFRAKIVHTEFFSEESREFLRVYESHQMQFFFRGIGITGNFSSPDKTNWGLINPSRNGTINVNLRSPTIINKGDSFILRDGGVTIGTGIVL